MTIVPLHNHSEYSSLDGWSSATEIACRCCEIEAPAVGLTDHGVVAGHLDFAKALDKVGVKPIFGIELYQGTKQTDFQGQRDASHLIALAMTNEGLRNLWRLSNATAREDHFYHVGRVFRDDILQYKEGIVFTSACALGLVSKGLVKDDYDDLNWFLNNLGDQFFIELSTYPGDKSFGDVDIDGSPINQRLINEGLVSLGLERGAQFVYGDDGHYSFRFQYERHDMYLALQTGQSIYTPIEERTMWHPRDALVIKDEDMVRGNLSYLPDRIVDEAIANAVAIGERATAQLPAIRRHLPVFIPKDCPFLDDEWSQLSAEDLFLRLVVDGIESRYPNANNEVWERTAYECETLINDGIYHYFLMGWDEIQFCNAEQIIYGPGRGSSAGCIVAYALGITDVDPLHYGLIFERFWNSGRAEGFPDIDSDFSQRLRYKVVDYLKDRWGHDKVCPIGTVGRMKPKKVCEKLMKGFGITQQECNELKTIVGKTKDIEIHGVDQIGWTRELEPGKVNYVEEDCGEEIESWIEAEPDRSFIRDNYVDMCKQACSRVHLYGIHPSGIVISDVPLSNELPAYLRGKKEERKAVTQFPMDDVDKRFFVKLDVLGLRTLDTLDYWKDMMLAEGVDVQWSGLDKQNQDEEMWDLLQDGFAAGVFQVESGYPKNLCERMNARSVEDIAVIVALNRPGPIGDGVPDRYIARRNGEEEVSYADPTLEKLLAPHLDPTYGLFVYQEQVIGYFNSLNYTLSESDVVRKILGKKKPEALAALYDGVDEWKGRGYMEMTQRAGIPEKAAHDVWRGLERFASYSFNKSHAVCYGVLGFRCCYAKYHGPAQFYASCIRTAENKKRAEMLPLYVNEARRFGLEVYPPDIVSSQSMCSVVSGNILFGFGDVKGVGNSGEYMVKLRDHDRLEHSTPEIFAEQFEELNKDYLKRKKERIKALAQGDKVEEIEIKSPKQHLSMGKIAAIFQAGAWDSIQPPDLLMAERQELEEELLGVILTDYTKEAFDTNAEEISGCDDWEYVKMPHSEKMKEYCVVHGEEPDDDMVFVHKVPGIVTSTQEKRGRKSGKSFGIVTIEYGKHALEFVVFNSAWHSHKFLFYIRTPGIFTLKHSPDSDYGPSYQFLKGHSLRP